MVGSSTYLPTYFASQTEVSIKKDSAILCFFKYLPKTFLCHVVVLGLDSRSGAFVFFCFLLFSFTLFVAFPLLRLDFTLLDSHEIQLSMIASFVEAFASGERVFVLFY